MWPIGQQPPLKRYETCPVSVSLPSSCRVTSLCISCLFSMLAIYSDLEIADAGGLVSYGLDAYHSDRMTAIGPLRLSLTWIGMSGVSDKAEVSGSRADGRL